MKAATPKKFVSPREFLKARRPEKFSDSVAEQTPSLDRSLLEYHLETLTSRSQENDFESFARRLAQCEICPNLLPHTGPTGGGDSKVDAETYPVADALSLTWFTGIGREAAQERWGFAFSAMKDWRQKLQLDIAKIAGTGRDYRKAFFVTNQFVPDRVRAEVEDELSQKHRFDVRVLDRTWILDKVFGGKHESLAIEELKLKTSIRTVLRKGPRDLQKQSELDAIETRIKEAGEQGRSGFSLAADCIDAVELARGLELPRSDVEGRLLRAKRVASESGTVHQQLLAAYQWAWTAFWWFEDYKTFSKEYAEVEKYATGSRNAYDLELLFNLWCNLQMAANSAKPAEDDLKLGDRARVLTTELNRLKNERERASTALQAETLALMMELITCRPEKSDALLNKLGHVIARCEGLAGFPLEPLVQVLTEVGDVLGERPAYQSLYETMVNTVGKRSGEVAAARLLVRRGAQELDADRPYHAIQSLGQALTRLYKHESRKELIKALYLCGNAYERVGLIWAARGTVLTAASVAANDYWTYAEVTPEQAACFARLKWLELQLGRLPHVMIWQETARPIQLILENQGYDLRRINEDEVLFDGCVAILLLKANLWQLKQMSRLPQILEKPADTGLPASERPDFFKKLRDQPASTQVPEAPYLYNERRVTLKSQILGCKITVEADNHSPCIELAESILAALESLLSTGMEHRLIAREPVLTINVRGSDFAKQPFAFEVVDREGRPHVEISSAAFHAHKMSREAQRELRTKLTELLANVLARVFVLDHSNQKLRKLLHDEHALDRSVEFTSSFVALGNVLGYTPKTTLDSWMDSAAREYPVNRSEEWDAVERQAKSVSTANQPRKLEMGKGEPPASLWQGSASHTEMETVSLIRETLWDRAKWTGTFFIWPLENQAPPVLALMFRNAEAGSEIFDQWRKELGTVDRQNRLRLTIIRGINKKRIHDYRVVIGSNPEANSSGDDSRLLFMVNRMCTMEPTTDRNLSGFLAKYDVFKAFFLAPAFLRDDSSEPEPILERSILKREINVRQAWEIGRNDSDSCGIREGDKPIIPKGQENAPILDVMRWLKQSRRSTGR